MNLKHLIGCMLVLVGMISCTQENDLPVDSTEPQTNTVSIQEAQEDLENLLANLENNAISRGDAQKHRVISECYTVKTAAGRSRSGETDSLNIHVFNFENKQGYAIMSGVRNYPSLIALTDSGELRPGQTVDNPGLGIFMQGLKLDFQEVDDDVLLPGLTSYKKYGRWSTTIYKQNGYCSVKWNQWKPYNKYCPKDNGIVCPTGCVPTAMGQLMSIYRYPVFYDVYTFFWTEMNEYPKADLCTALAKNDIARLLFEMGTKSNLNVNYKANNSSAKSSNIPRTLKNFGFANGGTVKDFNTSEVVSELLGGHSILVGGEKEEGGGHCWLVHGLMKRFRIVETFNRNHVLLSTEIESQWLLLCNWGWGGSDDGYYLSGIFNTMSGPYYKEDGTENRDNNSNGKYYKVNIKAITGIRR